MHGPVIAGVNGSAESLAAAEWAAREAARRDRSLRLVHVGNRHSRRSDGGSFPKRPAARQEAAAPGAAERHLARRVLREAEQRARRAVPGVRVTGEPVEGTATAALLKAAEQAAVLVLGSRGLSGVAGFLVGSVALGVVARATGPVVLVRMGEDNEDDHVPAAYDGPPARTGHRDVVLGLDVADPCDEVIEFAFEAARLRKARLRVVYAWQPPSALGLGPGDIALVNDPYRAQEWRGFLSAVLQVWRDKYPEVGILETVVREKASTALVRAAFGARLLVVGRHLADRPVRVRTGPVTHAVVHHVRCPVAVVPHR
ncbi:universal stress protein [Streptomyces sp. NPDC004629]|uniref:universal stress protein n=1 Tax=Streptomyces sp. NPDC004629 TaxID=3364705 RepID=UPI0036870842